MILDFSLILVFILSILIGYRKGFTQMLISCIVFLFSIFIVWAISGYLSELVINSDFGENILLKTKEGISKTLESSDKFVMQNLPFQTSISMDNVGKTAEQLAKNAFKALLSIPLTVVSFFLLKVLVSVARKIARNTAKLPIVGHLDSVLGLFFGLLSGTVLVGFIYFVLIQIQFLPSFGGLKQQIDTSYIVILISDIFV